MKTFASLAVAAGTAADAAGRRPTYGSGVVVEFVSDWRFKCGGKVYSEGDKAVVLSHKRLVDAAGKPRRAPKDQFLINHQVRPESCAALGRVDGAASWQITRAQDAITISERELRRRINALLADLLGSIAKAPAQ
ncbi:MAG: hypothetical protein AAFR79_08565 [Pseudomonadota bacterium]